MDEQTYVLVMEDVIFGLAVSVGVLNEEGCEEIVARYSQGGDWVPCANGCCHSKVGDGDFSSTLFKRVPIPVGVEGTAEKIESLREEVVSMGDIAAQMTAQFTIPEEDMN